MTYFLLTIVLLLCAAVGFLFWKFSKVNIQYRNQINLLKAKSKFYDLFYHQCTSYIKYLSLNQDHANYYSDEEIKYLKIHMSQIDSISKSKSKWEDSVRSKVKLFDTDSSPNKPMLSTADYSERAIIIHNNLYHELLKQNKDFLFKCDPSKNIDDNMDDCLAKSPSKYSIGQEVWFINKGCKRSQKTTISDVWMPKLSEKLDYCNDDPAFISYTYNLAAFPNLRFNEYMLFDTEELLESKSSLLFELEAKICEDLKTREQNGEDRNSLHHPKLD